MDSKARMVLKGLYLRLGRELWEDPVRCEGLLRDNCPELRPEIHAIMTCLKDGVPEELARSGADVPLEIVLASLSQRVSHGYGITPVCARWGVETWACAMDLISEGDCTPETEQVSQQLPSLTTARPGEKRSAWLVVGFFGVGMIILALFFANFGIVRAITKNVENLPAQDTPGKLTTQESRPGSNDERMAVPAEAITNAEDPGKSLTTFVLNLAKIPEPVSALVPTPPPSPSPTPAPTPFAGNLTQLTASAQSENSIELRWGGSVPEGAEVVIERQAKGESEKDSFRLSATQNPFIDSGLSPGTTYIYRGRVEAGAATSPELLASPIETLPLAPQVPSVKSFGQDRVDLLLPAYQPTSTQLVVLRSKHGGDEGFERLQSGGVAGQQFTDAGLTANQDYWYRIRAKNNSGESVDSPSCKVKTQATPAPTPTPTPRPTITPQQELRETRARALTNFVTQWLQDMASDDPQKWAQHFADPTEYVYAESGSMADRAFIAEDMRKLMKQYPQREYEIQSKEFEMTGDDEAKGTASFRYQYYGAKKNASGKATDELTLRWNDGDWQIVRFNETVERD